MTQPKPHPAIKNIYTDEEFERRMRSVAMQLRLLGDPSDHARVYDYVADTPRERAGAAQRQRFYDLGAERIQEARDLLTSKQRAIQ